jgi:hypothetical protein
LPEVANPLEAKRRIGSANKKTDKPDATGLAILLRNGILPDDGFQALGELSRRFQDMALK